MPRGPGKRIITEARMSWMALVCPFCRSNYNLDTRVQTLSSALNSERPSTDRPRLQWSRTPRPGSGDEPVASESATGKTSYVCFWVPVAGAMRGRGQTISNRFPRRITSNKFNKQNLHSFIRLQPTTGAKTLQLAAEPSSGGNPSRCLNRGSCTFRSAGSGGRAPQHAVLPPRADSQHRSTSANRNLRTSRLVRAELQEAYRLTMISRKPSGASACVVSPK